MTESTPQNASAVKRRQYLLLGGIAAVILGAALLSVALSNEPLTKAEKPPAKASKPTNPPARDSRRYIPSGAFTRAILLGGLDAPTGGQAQRNPQPVLLRLVDNAVLPNHFRSRIKECFVIGAGYGDMSSERAYIRTESLSCVTRDGTAIDVPIKGYVAGEDGKAGMRGRLRHRRRPRSGAARAVLHQPRGKSVPGNRSGRRTHG